MESSELFKNRLDLAPLSEAVLNIRQQIGRFIVGQRDLVEQMLIAILSDGHILIEGVPGIAKTLAAKLMARCINTGFSRIQFTPDLMPSDVTGTTVFNQGSGRFEFNSGPVFSNLILIDEINRAPAKTQAALFEVMEERQVTYDGTTYPMSRPFIVLATQNPIEQEGTYRLPEAQLDRFIFKINVDYPSLEEEAAILHIHDKSKGIKETDAIVPVLSAEEVQKYQSLVRQVVIEESQRNYIASIIVKTRNNSSLYLGASPRASIALMTTSKAYAAMQGRDFVIPEDIKKMAYPVLRHRIMLTPDREMEGVKIDEIVRQIVESVEVPR